MIQNASYKQKIKNASYKQKKNASYMRQNIVHLLDICLLEDN